ncbi:MAG: hypothetical protein MHM6MM_006974 [Cercozoa sp. M6MM]
MEALLDFVLRRRSSVHRLRRKDACAEERMRLRQSIEALPVDKRGSILREKPRLRRQRRPSLNAWAPADPCHMVDVTNVPRSPTPRRLSQILCGDSVESDDDALSVVTESTIDGEEPDLEFDLSRSEFWSSSVDVDDTAKRQRILQHKLSQALNNGVDLRACLRALQAGAQPSLPLRKVGDRALPSAWLWAATRSRMPVLRLLAQFDVSRSDLRDSLFMAAATGHYDVLDFLLTRFADEVRPDLAMALERAARYCQLESVERLCQEGPIASMKALIVCKSRRVKKVIRQYRSQYRRRLGRPSDEFVPRVPIRTHTYRILSQVQGQALPLDVVGEIVSFTFAKCDPEWV